MSYFDQFILGYTIFARLRRQNAWITTLIKVRSECVIDLFVSELSQQCELYNTVDRRHIKLEYNTHDIQHNTTKRNLKLFSDDELKRHPLALSESYGTSFESV